MERIRDFLYDISDLLISLLIIAAIFTVISWKLNESIPIDTLTAAPPPQEEPAASADTTSDEPDPLQPETEAQDSAADASDADKPIEIPAGDTVKPQNEPVPPAAGKSISIVIPSGSPGIAIGRILKENGLITDVNAFIQKVDELALGPKLRSGTYKLKTGMSLEQIIKVLANVN